MAANDNKRPDYEGYTREKKELDKLALPWKEYEKRLQEISRKHGL